MDSEIPSLECVKCSECGVLCSKKDFFIIDNTPVCFRCLFGEHSSIRIYPIGFVTSTQERNGSAFGLSRHSDVSRIELFPSQERFMYKLHEEKYLTVVYYLHKARSIKSRFNRGLDGKMVGVFASRTPDRLSGIGIQDVRLIRIEKTTLVVEGLDAVNGTPVLDIKMRRNRNL